MGSSKKKTPHACVVVKVGPEVEGHVGVKGLQGVCRGHGKGRAKYGEGHKIKELRLDGSFRGILLERFKVMLQ